MELAKRYMPKLDEISLVSSITMPTDDADMKPLGGKPRVCECCGAPLHGYVCDYCGVEYGNQIGATVSLDGTAAANAMYYYGANGACGGRGGNGASGSVIFRYPFTTISGGLL